MSRVIRRPQVAEAPLLFDSTPTFLGSDAIAAIDEATERAYTEGHRAGVEAGLWQLHGLAESIARSVEELRAIRAADVAGQVQAALVVARLVLGRAPFDDGQAVVERVLHALTLVDDETITIHVNAAEWGVVSAAVAAMEGVEAQSDPTLRPGEVRLIGRWSSVDGTHNALLGAVEAALQ